MSKSLKRYLVPSERVYTWATSDDLALGWTGVYLAADVDTLLRQREEEVAGWQHKFEEMYSAYQSEMDGAKQQLAAMTAERDEALTKSRWKHTHDDSLELELQKQLTATQARCAELEKAARYYWGCGCGWINDVVNVNCAQCSRTVLEGNGAAWPLTPTDRPVHEPKEEV